MGAHPNECRRLVSELNIRWCQRLVSEISVGVQYPTLVSCGGAATTVLAVLALTMTGCGRPPQPSLDEMARRYVRLAVALGERDPDSLDFYVGPAGFVADLRRDPPALPAIKRDAEGLSVEVSRQTSIDANRVRALVADLAAITARVDLLTGTRQSYDAESAAFFGVAPGPTDDQALARIRSQIADIVGRDGRLADRYSTFAARFTIPPDRLPSVISAAVDECRRTTVAHLALPPGDDVRLEFVRDKPWAAFSRYLGGARSVIQINTDFQLTIDQALQVACHEAYPGHHTRNTLIASSLADDRRPERAVQLMFSREALTSEATAMLAVDVAFPPAERVRVERERLFPLAGLHSSGAEQHVAVERLVSDLQVVQAGVARRYLNGDLEFARAVSALEEQALVPHAEALIKYVNQYRSYVTTYTTGRALAAARQAACTGPEPRDDVRWRCFVREILAR